MKPLFTIHAGEYIVGNHIEKTFPGLNLWVPARDTGIDLLVTDESNKKTVSLQVKASRDYLTTNMDPVFCEPLRACGWWVLNRRKIETSIADYWVFAITGIKRREIDFIIIRPSELLRKLTSIHEEAKSFHTYFWVTEKRRCWETRGLKRNMQEAIAADDFTDKRRDFTAHLNNWDFIEALR